MKEKRIDKTALASVVICAVLVVIGVVRLMSYSRGGVFGNLAEWPILSLVAYQPDDYISVQFFKILATPSVVAAIYFLIRLRNRSYRKASPVSYEKHGGRMDFESPLLRLVITGVISLHWVVMELIKYHAENFYPFSTLENPAMNALVLAASWALVFWSMKYLSFDPLFRNHV